MSLLDASAGPQSRTEADGLGVVAARRRWVWGWLLGGILAMLAAAALRISERAMFIAVPAWIALWGLLIFRNARARCPRCHGLFSNTRLGGNPFSKRCVHCGLSLPS
jgi:hypothetical protein